MRGSGIRTRIVEDENRRRQGLITDADEKAKVSRRLLITNQVEAWREQLRTDGSSRTHERQQCSYVTTAATACGWKAISDIDARSLPAYRVKMDGEGLSVRTRAARVQAVKQFANWLVQTGKLPANPLVTDKPKRRKSKGETNGRVFHRRVLLKDEWTWLEKAARAKDAPIRGGMTGPERALCYAVALQTALRAGELSAVTRADLHLDDTDPYIAVRAGTTKNGRGAHQGIVPATADELREHVRHLTPGAKVFGRLHPKKRVPMLLDDLADARALWIENGGEPSSDFLLEINAAGEKLDWHSLRHTTGAWLVQAGVDIKTVQAVMRHSSITMTLDTYGHMMPGSATAAIGTMADTFGSPQKPQGRRLAKAG